MVIGKFRLQRQSTYALVLMPLTYEAYILSSFKFSLRSRTMRIEWFCILTLLSLLFVHSHCEDPIFQSTHLRDAYNNTADENSTISLAPLPSGHSYETVTDYSDSLAGLSAMATGFVNTVLPQALSIGW